MPPRACAASSGRCGLGRDRHRDLTSLTLRLPRRWQRPVCSLLVCLGLNFLLLTLGRGACAGTGSVFCPEPRG